MRKSEADYVAVEAALRPHQTRTLSDYAAARGVDEWWEDTVACIVASALAAANTLDQQQRQGVSEPAAILQTATLLDLDPETLRRQRRRAKRQRTRSVTPDQ
jgi:hypothetical protein